MELLGSGSLSSHSRWRLRIKEKLKEFADRLRRWWTFGLKMTQTFFTGQLEMAIKTEKRWSC